MPRGEPLHYENFRPQQKGETLVDQSSGEVIEYKQSRRLMVSDTGIKDSKGHAVGEVIPYTRWQNLAYGGKNYAQRKAEQAQSAEKQGRAPGRTGPVPTKAPKAAPPTNVGISKVTPGREVPTPHVPPSRRDWDKLYNEYFFKKAREANDAGTPIPTDKELRNSKEWKQIQRALRQKNPNRSPRGALARALVNLGRRNPNSEYLVGTTPD